MDIFNFGRNSGKTITDEYLNQPSVVAAMEARNRKANIGKGKREAKQTKYAVRFSEKSNIVILYVEGSVESWTLAGVACSEKITLNTTEKALCKEYGLIPAKMVFIKGLNQSGIGAENISKRYDGEGIGLGKRQVERYIAAINKGAKM